MFQKTLIIGLGLIGGSFAKVLKKNSLSKEIVGCDPDSETIDFAKNSAVINSGFTELSFLIDELDSFDLIVVASPLSTYDEIFFDLKDAKNLVIDLGSIKNLDLEFYPKNFVPCHPIAGSENCGFEFSDENLFQNKKFIYCKENPKVIDLIKAIGAQAEFIEAKNHDKIYALVSHLPQFLSFLTSEFSPKKINENFFKNAFRLNDSDPEIWSDIIALNEENLEKFYDKFFDNLERNFSKSFTEIFDESRKATNLSKIFNEAEKLFLIKNFSEVFFRAIVAKSYLEIDEFETYKNYGGSGSRDFLSILEIFNFEGKELESLYNQNKGKIAKFFKSIQ